jgi:two-component system sensor histidine kinase KdpD
MAQQRPNPDELLRRVQEEEKRAKRGKLTVFFGAAPGVGKTYAMLEAARSERDLARDVVVGIVEPHGRYDTAALLFGREILPRRQIDYRGIRLEEFDVDAALKRQPGVILVDELAHTNAEGSRHPKRWQDVEELLDAGIDVYTTLNVQHIESLNDVVAQITGVIVRETVPDSVLERADEVRIIDLPPDELLERLQAGQVYVPEQARRALENFFKKGNLIALRELALRQTAARVDEQMRDFRVAHGIDRAWPVGVRLLVGVSPSPAAARLVRTARRIAAGLRCEWIAVYVETPAALHLAAVDRDRLAENLRLAEQLGAEVVTLTGQSAAEETLRFARSRNVTQIVVGRPHRRVRELRRGGGVDRARGSAARHRQAALELCGGGGNRGACGIGRVRPLRALGAGRHRNDLPARNRRRRDALRVWPGDSCGGAQRRHLRLLFRTADLHVLGLRRAPHRHVRRYVRCRDCDLESHEAHS